MHLSTITVAAGIIWRGRRFLAALRPPGAPFSGYWEFPGGKQEPGEDIVRALRRELEEELGIICGTVIPWRVTQHEYPGLLVKLHVMHVTSFTGRPRPRDGQRLLWVTPEKARTLRFLPADMELLALI